MDETEPVQARKLVPVCAIGASAGGVGALKELFRHLPDDLGVAYVVIMHLSPDHPSALDEILSSVTRMPVQQVADTPRLSPDCVYVIPPDRELVIEGDDVAARPFSEPRGGRAPIDRFFRSVAIGRGDGLAVILSGAGSDGALGVKAIKEGGGIIFVQEPASAEYPMMPRSALAAGVADFVAPIPRLVERMIEVVRSKKAIALLTGDAAGQVLLRIMGFLRARTGHDFSSYKRATVLRRVARRMQVTRSASMSGYAHYLVENPEEAQELLGELLISVTSFFRDPGAYEALAAKVIGPIFEAADEEAGIRAWVVGCATGEEAYSLAILFLEEAARRQVRTPIQVFATDLDEGALGIAREGRFPSSIEADISEERLQRFFVREGVHYRIRKEVRDVVLFATHSVLKDPPFMRIDLVSCRNLLIYLERELQREVCALFAYGLKPRGYLFLGSAETTDANPELFAPLDREARIYRARPQAARRLPVIAQLPPGHRPPVLERPRRPDAEERERSLGATHASALERAAPPSALVDRSYGVLHLSASAGRFLLPSAGPLSNDVAALARPELRLDLSTALRRALEHGEPTLTAPIPVAFNGGRRRVMLHVAPVAEATDGTPGHALVLFLDGGPVPDPDRADPGAASGELQRLRDELNVAEGRLTGSRADYESAIQDLRVANEELQSINEEYRSTAEELETSKEELQSMNEELQTVNAELKSKLESIGAAHSDLENLVAATDIGTLFLDPKLRIRMFTPRMAKLFNVTEADVGRTITDFTHQLTDDGLAQNARQVLQDLAPIEREVQTRDGRWQMLGVRPYRTIDNRIDGVVVTFFDITDLRRATEQVRASEQAYRALFETMSEGLVFAEVLTDASGAAVDVRYSGANPAAAAMMGIELDNRRLSEVGPGLEPHWREIPARVLAAGESERHEISAGPLGKWFDALFWKVQPGDTYVAILLRDVTERRRGEAELRAARDALALATQASSLGWGSWDLGTGAAEWDARGREIIGLGDEDRTTPDWLARVAPADRAAVEAAILDPGRAGGAFDLEYTVVHRDGSARLVHGTGTFLLDAGGRPLRGTGLVRDVTDRRRWEDAQRLLVGELNHRVKNMLAVVQSVAEQTRRGSADVAAFTEVFGQRIQALAVAHTLLTRRNWASGDLAELIEAAAASFVPTGDGRLRISGPSVPLRPDTTITFAMSLHELGTNSLKYGALSVAEGRVDVCWALEPSADGARVRFEWRESGGPPVARPSRNGFGTRLLEKGIARELDGTAELDYREEGLSFRLEFPFDAATRSN
jgi:two-component system CheB/CheR fusion protein